MTREELAACDLALLEQYRRQINAAEAAMWENDRLGVVANNLGKCIIGAPNQHVLISVVRDQRGLYVERHMNSSGASCDNFEVTPRGTTWKNHTTGRPLRFSSFAKLQTLSSVLQRFAEPHPGRAGYEGFLTGKDSADVIRQMIASGHRMHHPMILQALGQWGVACGRQLNEEQGL